MTPEAPIQFFNRYSGQLETEQVYGGKWLKWIYESRPGRLALHALVKRAAFSQFYGWLMNSERSRELILPFIETYRLDPGEFACPPEEFASFNEFFSRALRAGSRPIAADSDAAVFPADGRHFAVPDVSQMDGLFVKGQRFNLPRLIGDAALAGQFARGSLVLSRLCPVDYHRFHFPVDGLPGPPRLINGPLFSVSPIALRRRLDYLWENKRVLTVMRSPRFGTVLVIEIGATNVGSIVQTFRPGLPAARGQEKGLFRFGGSSTIIMYEPGRIDLAADLIQQSARGIELYARMGDEMGRRAAGADKNCESAGANT